MPLSKGQTNTNINKNSNDNGNYEFLFNFLFSLLDNSEEEEIEIPVPVIPPVYTPTKPCKNCYPGNPDDDDDDDDDEDDDSYPGMTTTEKYYKPPTTSHGYVPYQPTIAVHKPCKHCPVKPTPYQPYKIPSGPYYNKNTNVASNKNMNDDTLVAEEDVNSQSEFRKAGVKRTTGAAN